MERVIWIPHKHALHSTLDLFSSIPDTALHSFPSLSRCLCLAVAIDFVTCDSLSSLTPKVHCRLVSSRHRIIYPAMAFPRRQLPLHHYPWSRQAQKSPLSLPSQSHSHSIPSRMLPPWVSQNETTVHWSSLVEQNSPARSRIVIALLATSPVVVIVTGAPDTDTFIRNPPNKRTPGTPLASPA